MPNSALVVAETNTGVKKPIIKTETGIQTMNKLEMMAEHAEQFFKPDTTVADVIAELGLNQEELAIFLSALASGSSELHNMLDLKELDPMIKVDIKLSTPLVINLLLVGMFLEQLKYRKVVTN